MLEKSTIKKKDAVTLKNKTNKIYLISYTIETIFS